MNTFSITTSLISHSLAWALLHSLWQGLIIFSALYILLKALPGMNARIRHYLSFGSFTALFLWFADTWAAEYQKLKGIAVYITQPGYGSAAATTYVARTISAEHLQSPMLHRYIPNLEKYFPFIILIYTAGLAFMLFRFVINVLQVKALRTDGITKPESHWCDFIDQWRDRFDIARHVTLLLSDRINVPMMLGTLKPVILLPVATINYLSTEQVESIILHELAHIRRHDYLLNIIQTIIEAVLFFNPFVWLISGIIRREREHCCDDLVVAHSANPLTYAKALAVLESNRITENHLALAATGNNHQLFNRIKRIMEMKKSNMHNSQLTVVIVAIIAITVTTAMFTFTPSFAQKAKSEKKTDTTSTKKTVYKYKTVTIDSNGKKTVVEKESSTPLDEFEKNKQGDDEDGGVGTGGSNGSGHSSSSSYSYSFSDDMDGADMKKMIKKIIVETRKAAKSINMEELEREIEKEMENVQNEIDKIDWQSIYREVDKGIDEVEKELENARRNKTVSIEIRHNLEKTKKDLEHTKKELENTRRRVYVSAHAGNSRGANVVVVADGDDNDETLPAPPPAPPTDPVRPAAPVAPAIPAAPDAPAPPSPRVVVRSGNNDIETMLKEMEHEGLIDRDKKYSVEKKDEKLYINGDRQPDDVYRRYQKYLRHGAVSIKGRKGSLSISIHD